MAEGMNVLLILACLFFFVAYALVVTSWKP